MHRCLHSATLKKAYIRDVSLLSMFQFHGTQTAAGIASIGTSMLPTSVLQALLDNLPVLLHEGSASNDHAGIIGP